MNRLIVQIIHLIGLADALFLDEDDAAQGAAGGDVAGGDDVDHAK